MVCLINRQVIPRLQDTIQPVEMLGSQRVQNKSHGSIPRPQPGNDLTERHSYRFVNGQGESVG